MTPNNNEPLDIFYIRLIKNVAWTLLKRVREENNIAENPTSGDQIRPIPVYEEGEFSLLSCVNIDMPTTILWPAVPPDIYVPAYYKRYRGPDKSPRNEVVVIADNYCHARFFAAKELMHCMIDDDGHSATNTITAANQLIAELCTANSKLSCAPQTLVDEIAWIGALHYTIPDGWLPLLRKMVADLQNAGPDFAPHAHLHVATLIRVPELFLRYRLQPASQAI